MVKNRDGSVMDLFVMQWNWWFNKPHEKEKYKIILKKNVVTFEFKFVGDSFILQQGD